MSEVKTIPTWADVKAACDQDGKHMRESMPANWYGTEYTNGVPMSVEPNWEIPMALLNYLQDNDHKCGDALSQLIESFATPKPVFEAEDESAGYVVFSDDSLYFWNNSEDEVWSDYCDYIREALDDGVWDDLYAMDQAILTYYHGGDVEEAKERYES